MNTNTGGLPLPLPVRTRLVQPCTRRRHSASPETQRAPPDHRPATLTFSLMTRKDSDTAPAAVMLTLLKAEHLNRPDIRPLPSHSFSSGTNFVTEGLFARIYKKDQRPQLGSDQRKQNLIQTPIIRSSESAAIEFPHQTMQLQESDFPVRVTLYDVDMNGVRFSLGHTFIGMSDEEIFAPGEAVILTHDLWPTICSAMQDHTACH